MQAITSIALSAYFIAAGAFALAVIAHSVGRIAAALRSNTEEN